MNIWFYSSELDISFNIIMKIKEFIVLQSNELLIRNSFPTDLVFWGSLVEFFQVRFLLFGGHQVRSFILLPLKYNQRLEHCIPNITRYALARTKQCIYWNFCCSFLPLYWCLLVKHISSLSIYSDDNILVLLLSTLMTSDIHQHIAIVFSIVSFLTFCCSSTTLYKLLL